jgi:hypothetical protein
MEIAMSKKIDPSFIRGIQQKLEEALVTMNADATHNSKRSASFESLDYMLNCCRCGKCPSIPDISTWHYFLTDISIDGYVLFRAHLDSENGVGIHDLDRYNRAKLYTLYTLFCRGCPSTSIINLVDHDSSSLQGMSSSAKKRKAYWSHMKNNFSSDETHDYYDACSIVEKYSGPLGSNRSSLLELQTNWLNNTHILNGVDIFRFCVLRYGVLKCSESATPPA